MDQIKHLSIYCFRQDVQRSFNKAVHIRSKTKKTVLVKSKLKILAYKPKVQQTDLSFVYETCQTSHAENVLICHNLRMPFRCILRFLFTDALDILHVYTCCFDQHVNIKYTCSIIHLDNKGICYTCIFNICTVLYMVTILLLDSIPKNYLI